MKQKLLKNGWHTNVLDRLYVFTALFLLASTMEVFGFTVVWSPFFPLNNRLPNISGNKVCQENAV